MKGRTITTLRRCLQLELELLPVVREASDHQEGIGRVSDVLLRTKATGRVHGLLDLASEPVQLGNALLLGRDVRLKFGRQPLFGLHQ